MAKVNKSNEKTKQSTSKNMTFKKARTHKGRKFLQSFEPSQIEIFRKVMFLKGTKASQKV